MQGNVQHSTSRNPGVTMMWTPEEWHLITVELHHRNPGAKYTSFTQCPFTLLELEDASEAVLPQERHRLIEDFTEVRAYLFDACQRLYAGDFRVQTPMRTAKEDRIVWKPHEWEAVTKELYANFPYLFDDNLKDFGAGHFRVAQSALLPDRQRPLKHRREMAEMLWKEWQDHGERFKKELQEKRQAVQFGKSIVVQPVEKHSDNSNPIALAVHKAFKEPPKEKPVKLSKKEAKAKLAKSPVYVSKMPAKRPSYKRVDWTDDEWMNVARAMVQRDTVNHYLGNEQPNIVLLDIKKAQELALPKERQRTLQQASKCVPRLWECFETIRQERLELEKAKEEPKSIPVIQHTAYVEKLNVAVDQVKQVKADEVATETPFTPVVVAAEDVMVTAKEVPPTDFVAALAQAAAPVLTVVLERLAGIIAPQVAGMLLPELIKAMPQPVAAPVAEPVNTPVVHVAQPVDYAAIRTIVSSVQSEANAKFNTSVQTGLKEIEARLESRIEARLEAQFKALKAAIVVPAPNMPAGQIEAPVAPSSASYEVEAEPAKDKIKLPKITLIGPLGAQQADLKRSYPQLDLCFIESGKGIREGANNCELFIVNQKNCNSAMRDDVKRYVPKEILEAVHGGVSSMKFLIDAWLKKHPEVQ